MTMKQTGTGEMGQLVLVWGWDGTNWVPVLVDAAGNLQVDVVSSALPTGAATQLTLGQLNNTTNLQYNNIVTINSNISAIKNYIDDLPTSSVMSTDRLLVNADTETDTVAPAGGKKIEVLGFIIEQHAPAALTYEAPAFLYFATSGIYLWSAPEDSVLAAAMKDSVSISNIRVQGAADEVLTLTNYNWTAGASSVAAVVYYREV